LGQATSERELLEERDDARSWDRRLDEDARRAPRELIDHGEAAKAPAVGQVVGDEVHRPALVGLCHLREIHPRRRSETRTTFGPHEQSLALVEPIDALVIDVVATTTQLAVDTAVPCTRPLRRNRAHRLDELGLILRTRLVANRRALYAD